VAEAKQAAIHTVGFIGLGIMGSSMAGHLMDAGYSLHVTNRSRDKAEPLVARGAVWHDGIADLAGVCDAVVTIVGYPIDVRQVYLDADGLIAHARPGTLLIDMTTSNPSLARLIAEAAAARGMAALDAPVSGGDVGAREATLAIMAGGEEAAFSRALPLFQAMGGTIRRLGPAGAGQHAKMVNQIVIAGTIMGVAEGMAYARRSGLDPKAVLAVIGTGAAGGSQLNKLGPRMIDGDFAPGFYIHHFIKDMGIALEEAAAMGLDLPALALSKSRYDELSGLGYGSDGTQALLRLYQDDPGV
jgi:3-hydroxyisobutyrate dehydrogenase